MDIPLSKRQYEAREFGVSRETVKYLNRHPLIAIISFTLIIISGLLWSEFIFSLIFNIFGVPRERMKVWVWFVMATVITFIVYILIKYIIKVPITAAYSL